MTLTEGNSWAFTFDYENSISYWCPDIICSFLYKMQTLSLVSFLLWAVLAIKLFNSSHSFCIFVFFVSLHFYTLPFYFVTMFFFLCVCSVKHPEIAILFHQCVMSLLENKFNKFVSFLLMCFPCASTVSGLVSVCFVFVCLTNYRPPLLKLKIHFILGTRILHMRCVFEINL